eukprot:scaffold1549_cov156-Amphora_coffeaeformis.AAC.7
MTLLRFSPSILRSSLERLSRRTLSIKVVASRSSSKLSPITAAAAPLQSRYWRIRSYLDRSPCLPSSSLNLPKRFFSRTSLDAPETPYDKAVTFVVSIGYEREIAEGVVDALKQSGLSGEALLSMTRALAGRWEVGEDEGLEALAASVKQDIAAKRGQKVIITIVPPNAWDSAEDPATENIVPNFKDIDESLRNRSFEVEAYEGVSLTDVAKFGTGRGAETLGEYLECACSGIMACSTCHVVVDKEWYAKVGEPTDDEQDMLDLAYGPRPSSRLGCQVILKPEFDGMILFLPKGQNNLMDHIPFEG